MIKNLMRKDLQNLKPYSSARSLYGPESGLCFLDANENPTNTYSSYPEPQPKKLINTFSKLYQVSTNNLLITRGIDEGIDCLLRTFGTPQKDSIIVFEPTYDLYRLSASLQQLQVINVPLNKTTFQINLDLFKQDYSSSIKCVFICSPNNPTGNCIELDTVISILEHCQNKSLVIIDEAYIEFSQQASYTSLLSKYPHLVILRTLSKAYGMAGVRCGFIIAHADIVKACLVSLAPYPIPSPSVDVILERITQFNKPLFLKQKQSLLEGLSLCPHIKKVFPSEANFFLFQCPQPKLLFNALLEKGILIRDRQKKVANTLRVSLGNELENKKFLQALREIKQ